MEFHKASNKFTGGFFQSIKTLVNEWWEAETGSFD